MSKRDGEVRMENGPSFNLRTPWNPHPTEDDYAIADAREEAWIKGQIQARNLPFTFVDLRTFVSRNFHILSGSDYAIALAIVQDSESTLYRLFWVATQIHDAMSEAQS